MTSAVVVLLCLAIMSMRNINRVYLSSCVIILLIAHLTTIEACKDFCHIEDFCVLRCPLEVSFYSGSLELVVAVAFVVRSFQGSFIPLYFAFYLSSDDSFSYVVCPMFVVSFRSFIPSFRFATSLPVLQSESGGVQVNFETVSSQSPSSGPFPTPSCSLLSSVFLPPIGPIARVPELKGGGSSAGILNM